MLPANVRSSCAAVVKIGQARCLALLRTDVGDALPGHVTPLDEKVPGYGPADLGLAYNIPTTGGAGQTVAIVDAYDDPNAEADLGVYRSHFGLSSCTTANGCFQKLNQSGAVGPYPTPDSGWASEISLDLDMVSAGCPACNIMLIEANTNFFVDLGASVNTAAALGAGVVSNSYSGGEFSARDKDYSHPGHVIIAASGDDGLGPTQPCSLASVVCVGGTTLTKGGKHAGTRGWTETAWAGTGSGCSEAVAKPSWQHDTGCLNRTEVDISAIADPETGIAMYDSYGQCCWFVYGGTSVATPILASLYALAGNDTTQDAAKRIWNQKGNHLFDITSGRNGICQQKYICEAGVGYDGPTGWGTPNGIGIF
jgi:subtilase family serine protease